MTLLEAVFFSSILSHQLFLKRILLRAVSESTEVKSRVRTLSFIGRLPYKTSQTFEGFLNPHFSHRDVAARIFAQRYRLLNGFLYPFHIKHMFSVYIAIGGYHQHCRLVPHTIIANSFTRPRTIVLVIG